MTLGLTYNDDLSRVQISVTDLPDVDTVTIERSTNGVYWQTVRGGAAVPVAGGTASLDDYEFSADTENFYRVSGLVASLHLPGVSGAYASTPDHASLDITGDLDLRADITPDSWTPATNQAIVSKYHTTGNQRSYYLRITAGGTLTLLWSTNGTTFSTVDSTVNLPAGGRRSVRATLDVDNGASGHTVTFYTAPSLAGPWTMLGAPVVTGGTTSVHAGTAALTISGTNAGTANHFEGRIHAIEVRNGIDGTVAAGPDFAEVPPGATSFPDVSGRTWALHGSAAVVADPVVESASITPSLDGRTWLKSIKFPFLNRPYSVGHVDDDATDSRDVVYPVQGRSVGVAVTDVRSGGSFTLTLRTATPTESRNLDLTIRAGGTFFLHTPAGSQIPGGYVAITGPASMDRFGPVSTRRRWPLPCTVVAAPAPAIVGGTMTYRALINLYGSYQNVLAANPAYADLLDLMASPDDLLVI